MPSDKLTELGIKKSKSGKKEKKLYDGQGLYRPDFEVSVDGSMKCF